MKKATTVAEVIAALEQFDPNMEVWGYENNDHSYFQFSVETETIDEGCHMGGKRTNKEKTVVILDCGDSVRATESDYD